MATGKRYYWIKLKESFMTSDAVDFLMGQPGGANYVVLYQMLCLKTINTDGRLSRQIGEIIIPYDEEKIARDTKWFSVDTVRVALNLYKALGLVYQDCDGVLALTDHENLVGSETDWADKRRRQRLGNSSQPELPTGDNVPTDVPQNVPTEKEIRDRDQRLEKDIETEKEDLTISDEMVCRPEAVRRVVERWNTLGLQVIRKVPSAESKTGQRLRARIREYGEEAVLEAIEKVRNSDFLMGRATDFTITLDWFSRPNNFPKVINGNYDKRQDHQQQTKAGQELQASYGMMQRWKESREDPHDG